MVESDEEGSSISVWIYWIINALNISTNSREFIISAKKKEDTYTQSEKFLH